MSEPTLPTYTAAQLTQIYMENRSSVMNEIIRHCHTVILERVAAGKSSITITHMYMHTEWMKDAQFVIDLQAGIQALFPESTIVVAPLVEESDYVVTFSYTPV